MPVRWLSCIGAAVLGWGMLSAAVGTQEASTEPPAEAKALVKAPAKPDAKGEAAAASKFLRIRRDQQQEPVAMQTAVTSYAPASGKSPGLQVDLIAAVHIGDKAYYDELNKRFAAYDVVLYELVTSENAPPPVPGTVSTHPISLLQRLMKNVLELQFQLDCIDYTRSNFVHADMTPSEFSESMQRRGESFWQMLWRAMGQSFALQAKGSAKSNDAEFVAALFSRHRALKLKRALAEQFQDLETQMANLFGPDGSTIITERNKKALAVLKKEIDSGHKRIAIFYGAGHLADMEQRLRDDFGLKPTQQQWVTAWSMADPPAK